MSKRNVVPDPIAGTIELPPWVVAIKNEPAIRRMILIRQLGLKAYIDYPGAIHTRYSHSLGTMFLAGRLVESLKQKMHDSGKYVIESNLKDNKNNIMAAGFLHDIAHGPFSHCVDFAMETITGKKHQELAKDIIEKHLSDEIDRWGLNRGQIIKIILGEHDYNFISQIIDGQMDVDKLDYLLRDAYHVGLRYSFDLDHFLNSHTILGNLDILEECELGIENTQQAIVATEIFLVIWKSMYDLVYHVQDSRIAEKMLEKVILLNKDEEIIKDMFLNSENFLELNDDNLLSKLSDINDLSKNIVNGIKNNKLYKLVLDTELNSDNFDFSNKLLEMSNDEDKFSNYLSNVLNETYKKDNYNYICDIITSKSPKDIKINVEDKKSGEYVLLRDKSKIVGSIEKIRKLKVYSHPSLDDKGEAVIFQTMKEIIQGI